MRTASAEARLSSLSMAGLDPAIQGHRLSRFEFVPLDGRLGAGHDVGMAHRPADQHGKCDPSVDAAIATLSRTAVPA